MEVFYGPRKLGGADFKLLTVQQGIIAQMMYFLHHWRTQSSVGKLLKCALAWIQLGVGISFSVLEKTDVSLPHLQSKWIASLCSFLMSIRASIQLDDPCVPALQRKHDCYLMDIIIQTGRFKPAEVRKLNDCQLHLNAVTLADITKPNGIDLDPCLLAGQPSLYSGCTSWHTINQDRPSDSKEWRLWQVANILWSDLQAKLHRPLGAWLYPLPDLRFQFFAYTYRCTLSVQRMVNTLSSVNMAFSRYFGHPPRLPQDPALSSLVERAA